jgi:putative Holliday junction resolvase
MALDVGDRRVGVAVSDRMGIIAQALETFERRGRRVDMAHLDTLITQNEVTRIVVGWPLELSGRAGAQAQKTQRFVDDIIAHTGLPVDKWDERMTSVAAERILGEVRGGRAKRKKGTVDKIAATLILQGWLDAHR